MSFDYSKMILNDEMERLIKIKNILEDGRRKTTTERRHIKDLRQAKLILKSAEKEENN